MKFCSFTIKKMHWKPFCLLKQASPQKTTPVCFPWFTITNINTKMWFVWAKFWDVEIWLLFIDLANSLMEQYFLIYFLFVVSVEFFVSWKAKLVIVMWTQSTSCKFFFNSWKRRVGEIVGGRMGKRKTNYFVHG